jgi:hypothetical protein
MRPHSWQVSFSHSPAIAQITLSSVELCLSLSEVVCSRALWNKTLLQSFNVFYASTNCLHFIKNKFSCFFIFFEVTLYFHDFLEPNQCFTVKMNSDVCGCFTGPNYYN